MYVRAGNNAEYAAAQRQTQSINRRAARRRDIFPQRLCRRRRRRRWEGQRWRSTRDDERIIEE